MNQSHVVIFHSDQKGATFANKYVVSASKDTCSCFIEIYFKRMLKIKQPTLMFYVQFKFPSHRKEKKNVQIICISQNRLT